MSSSYSKWVSSKEKDYFNLTSIIISELETQLCKCFDEFDSCFTQKIFHLISILSNIDKVKCINVNCSIDLDKLYESLNNLDQLCNNCDNSHLRCKSKDHGLYGLLNGDKLVFEAKFELYDCKTQFCIRFNFVICDLELEHLDLEKECGKCPHEKECDNDDKCCKDKNICEKLESWFNDYNNSLNNNAHTIKKTFDESPCENVYDTATWVDCSGNLVYPWIFSKCLKVDPISGMSTVDDVDKVLDAICNTTETTLDKISLAPDSKRLLEGVPVSKSYPLMGKNPYIDVDPYPINDDRAIFEMMEVYCMALTRDVSFCDFATDPTVTCCIDLLNAFPPSAKTGPTIMGQITSKTFMRGNGPGELVGPYMSQFLLLDYQYGNLTIKQQYTNEVGSECLSVDPNEWVKIQEGCHTGDISNNGLFYASSPRVLGSMVHNDPLYAFYYNAALIALQHNIRPEHGNYSTSTQWATGGPPDIFSAVAHVAEGALRVAWSSKWLHAMYVRPEVYAQRLNLYRSDPSTVSYTHLTLPTKRIV